MGCTVSKKNINKKEEEEEEIEYFINLSNQFKSQRSFASSNIIVEE